MRVYDRLYSEFGPRRWWPADTPFEVIVGAILTQNTSWSNVEKAIANLKRERLLSPASMASLKKGRLARLIRPAGYYNVKAERLKSFMDFLSKEFNGSLKRLFRLPTEDLRGRLLATKGIGPETADSILLYAAERPVFVVDAYTRRVFSRHKLVRADARYDEVQSLFMENLPRRTPLFNEYHALIVHLCKIFCKKRPLCTTCPLWGQVSTFNKKMSDRRSLLNVET